MDDGAVLKKRGYTLGIHLGEGSYAKVKCAYSERLKTNVAVKIIDRKKAPVDFLEKFLPRELEILALLNHRYVIKTYEIFETSEGKIYIIMELGVQGDLLEFIKTRGALPDEVSRQMFRQLALAVRYCHELDVVHRDLKCENILLDKDFNVKLSDFGFAKRCGNDSQGKPSLSKTFCGSAAYAAPEVLQATPYQPKSCDIWSLGVILFIMVCGSMPYDDSNIKRMLRLQKEHRVDFPRSSLVAGDCRDLIYHMLNPDASKRLTVGEVLEHPWLSSTKKRESSLFIKAGKHAERHGGHKKEGKPAGKSQHKQGGEYEWEPDPGRGQADSKHEAKHEWMNMRPGQEAGKQEGQEEHAGPEKEASPPGRTEGAAPQRQGAMEADHKDGPKARVEQGLSGTEAGSGGALAVEQRARSLRIKSKDLTNDSEVYSDQENFLEAMSKAELKKESLNRSTSAEKKGKHLQKSHY
ncbi:testis-specific serine/threonine-protein kinase 1-like [Narcine bancroftii]|uniref:testis-specific serine/threonine-protein kinase 1-like n=1 Tax=Narcine bancroftii TaxID=1343680 RepID=UPI00383126DD